MMNGKSKFVHQKFHELDSWDPQFDILVTILERPSWVLDFSCVCKLLYPCWQCEVKSYSLFSFLLAPKFTRAVSLFLPSTDDQSYVSFCFLVD